MRLSSVLWLVAATCATSQQRTSDVAKTRDTDVVKTVTTGPETITTTIDTYAPPTCAPGEALRPDGMGSHYCSAAEEGLQHEPKTTPKSDPNAKASQENNGSEREPHELGYQVFHGPLLSHEVIVDARAATVSTTDAKAETKTDAKVEESKATTRRWGPGPLGWALIAVGTLAALALAWRFKVWTLL